jgi:hypothetical protein
MSAVIQVFREVERLGVRVSLAGASNLRLTGLPKTREGQELIELIKLHKAEVIDRLTPWRWWQCPCGHEVRADQLRCPLPWCRMPRTGAVHEF